MAPINKTIITLFLPLSLICCGPDKSSSEEQVNKTSINDQNTERKEVRSEQTPSVEEIAPKGNIPVVDLAIDSFLLKDIQTLDSSYASTPLFAQVGGKNYYYICDGNYDDYVKRFNGVLKYGIANDELQTILEPEFDKIYNPNLTLVQCMEVKNGRLVGLFNYTTQKLVGPEFDYILPGSKKNPELAYGHKNDEWYEISPVTMKPQRLENFNPIEVFKKISLNIDELGESMLYDSYKLLNAQEREEGEGLGKGVLVFPSYLEYLKIVSYETIEDYILPGDENAGFGTESFNLEMKTSTTLFDKLTAFFIGIYESGIDARGYTADNRTLLVYNPDNKKFQASDVSAKMYYYSNCHVPDYRILNDSTLEVEYGGEMEAYTLGTQYSYHQISKNGKITPLESNRQFDFTKFVIIDKDYFKGCYINPPGPTSDDGGMWIRLEHLTIEDLDIMRNEIYAEYGYNFKSKKWNEYFILKDWYLPLHDNVDDRLTEIDKANIQTILEVKEAMKGREEDFTQKGFIEHVIPG